MSEVQLGITLTCYGPAAALAGRRTAPLLVSEGTDVAGLRLVIGESIPALAALLPRCAIAVGGSLAPENRPLRAGDCVDLLPPVSGG